jgi:hypothetical protein
MKKGKFSIPKKYLPYLKNKYVLTFLGALIWLSFFDRNDFITTYEYHKRLTNLCKEEAFYDAEVKRYTEDLNNLVSNPSSLEKFGREKYLMKRDNEDVYVVVDERKKSTED